MTPSDGASVASKTLFGLIRPIPADQTAIIIPESELRITYGGLPRSRSRRWPKRWRRPASNRGDRVGMALPNGLPTIVSFLAASMAGTAAPLNPGYKEDEFRFFLEDTDARC